MHRHQKRHDRCASGQDQGSFCDLPGTEGREGDESPVDPWRIGLYGPVGSSPDLGCILGYGDRPTALNEITDRLDSPVRLVEITTTSTSMACCVRSGEGTFPTARCATRYGLPRCSAHARPASGRLARRPADHDAVHQVGPAAAWTGTLPTSWPPTSPEPPR